MKNTKALGDVGEEIASEYLTGHGYKIITRNFRSRYGEIDIIAVRDDILIFVEVKQKSGVRFGHPGEMITPKKLEKIRKTAFFYIQENEYNGPWRVDAVLVAGDKVLEHLQNISM